MLRSMTGFARTSGNLASGKIVLEIYSLNRKQLDMAVSLPREFSRFEVEFRKQISSQISRGQVQLKVFFFPNAQKIRRELPSMETLKELKKEWEKRAKGAGFSAEEVNLSLVVNHLPDTASLALASEEEGKEVSEILDKALLSLLAMKEKEGKVLVKDLKARLKYLRKRSLEIEKLAPLSAEKMRARLEEKMQALFPLSSVDERLLKEVALFSEKVDFSEEMTRLSSHLEQMESFLSGKEPVSGRTLEFLLQEMGREINTTGSKANDAAISKVVVSMKAELEKMKEQVLNIE